MSIDKSFTLLLTFCLVCLPFSPKAQFFDWAGHIKSSASSSGMFIDIHSNTYLTGSFDGYTDFDPGEGEYELFGLAGASFITKIDSLGRLEWAKKFDGQMNVGIDIQSDSEGNVITIGSCGGSIDLNPNEAVPWVYCPGVFQGYISKLDSEGRFVWGGVITGPGYIDLVSLEIDKDDNILISGTLDRTMDFDMGVDTAYFTAAGFDNAFVAKYSPEGMLIWVRIIQSEYSQYVQDMRLDSDGNILIGSLFSSPIDADPGDEVYILTPVEGYDTYVAKWTADGDFVWAKALLCSQNSRVVALAINQFDDIILTGQFTDTFDLDPGPGEHLVFANYYNLFITKWDTDGNFIWGRGIGESGTLSATGLACDKQGNIYAAGLFALPTDFDPGPLQYELTAPGTKDLFILKLNAEGNFRWVSRHSEGYREQVTAICAGVDGKIYTAGNFSFFIDVDPGPAVDLLKSLNSSSNIFLMRFTQSGIRGMVYNDLDFSCMLDHEEEGIGYRRGILQPGGIILETRPSGVWQIDTLPPGTYTISFDTSGLWRTVCSNTIEFTVTGLDPIVDAPDYGMYNILSCTEPHISVDVGPLRPCFSNGRINIRACNQPSATAILFDAYAIVELDSLIEINDATHSYIDLGNDRYQFDLGNIYPGICINLDLSVTLDCDDVLGTTHCIKSSIHPTDSCYYISGETITPPDDPNCSLYWDMSDLHITAYCRNDSLFFLTTNKADSIIGDMQCSAARRLYVDELLLKVDSLKLMGHEQDTLILSGDGRTWRLEIDQHNLHPGRSKPSATLERCGSQENWTPELVNTFSQNDEDGNIDIDCRVSSESADPNDKTGYPLGITSQHIIESNGKMDYVIRFQNTGTDTAFTVIIRDTLDTDLNIYSVQNGVSSHPYKFRMYGPRVLEWYFENILLVDSTTNEPASHGYVTFTVRQHHDLPDSTLITNKAAIYFDFNEPIITNQTQHRVGYEVLHSPPTAKKEIWINACEPIEFNSLLYEKSGEYFQVIQSITGPDTLLTIHLQLPQLIDTSILVTPTSISTTIIGNSYQWINCESGEPLPGANLSTFTPTLSGSYALVLEQSGCVDTSSCFQLLITSNHSPDPNIQVHISPNPTRSEFSISTDPPLRDVVIEIFNEVGEVCYFNKVDYLHYKKIRLEGSAGMYFIRVITEDGNWTGKILLL